MKNEQGLHRLSTVYNGMLYIGKKLHFIHETASEKVFAITCSKSKKQIELTTYEAQCLRDELNNFLKETK